MMTLSIKEAYSLHEAMAGIITSSNSASIKGKAGLAFSYNFRLLHEAISEYITKRNDIINKYADVISEEEKEKYDKEGIIPPTTITDPDKLREANKEIAEFEDLKIEIPVMIISTDDILKCEDIDTYVMQLLIWMTKEFEEDKNKIKEVK